MPRTRVIAGRRYPSRHDYEEWAVAGGLAETRGTVWSDPAVVAKVQSHWFMLGQSGCVFAQHLMASSASAAWHAFVCPSPATPEDGDWTHSLDELIAREIANPSCELMSMLFPATVTESQLVVLIRTLLGCDRMELLPLQVACESVGVSLRLNVGMANVCESWVLGFGPFECLPATRQAPVTEIVFRTKESAHAPRQEGVRSGNYVHVADFPLHLPEKKRASLWHASVLNRQALLGPHDETFAKARFSFALPAHEARAFAPDL